MPLNLLNKVITVALEPIEGNYSKIFTYNSSDIGNEWKQFDPNNLSISNITKIDTTTGYWIKMIKNGTLTIEGTAIKETNFTLKQGWNLISYPSTEIKQVNDAFGNVWDDFNIILSYNNSAIYPWKSFNKNKPFYLNTLVNMTPGYGYWVKVSNDTIWYFNGTFTK